MTRCTSCGSKFSASEALCDDWKDPEKSYGCPACGTFYVKDMRPRWLPAVVGGLAGGGIGTPAVFLLMDGIRSGDTQNIVMSGSIILSLLALAVVLGRTEWEEARVSPYRREREEHTRLGDTTNDA